MCHRLIRGSEIGRGQFVSLDDAVGYRRRVPREEGGAFLHVTDPQVHLAGRHTGRGPVNHRCTATRPERVHGLDFVAVLREGRQTSVRVLQNCRDEQIYQLMSGYLG